MANSVLTVWKPGQFGHKSQKKLFFFQLILSLVLPSGQLAFSLIRGLQYTRASPYSMFCVSPASGNFYSFMLPADILILCGTVMSVYVMVKLSQVRKTLSNY